MFIYNPVLAFSQHYAARNGHLSVCRTLLGKGADVNMRTRSGGATALHRASYRGQLQVVNLLLEAKADKLLKDNDGQTALHKVHINLFAPSEYAVHDEEQIIFVFPYPRSKHLLKCKLEIQFMIFSSAKLRKVTSRYTGS